MNRSIANAAAVGIAVVAVWAAACRREHEPLAQLAERAARVSHRLVRPRLTGPFTYAPFAEPVRGTSEVEDATLQLRIVAAARTDSSDRHVAGIAWLLAGQAARSVELLRAASTTGGAEAWSDLSAALLVQSDESGAIMPAVDALAAADEALRASPKHPAATFNRALALERLGLLDDARAGWNQFRAIEPASAWTAEASAAATRLDRDLRGQGDWSAARQELENAIRRGDLAETRRLLALHPRDARAWGESVYPTGWAEAVERNDDVAARTQVDLSGAVGDALRATSGERLLADAVHAMRESSGDPTRRKLLARAYLTYRMGRMDHSRNAATAAGRLKEAADLFSRAGSPMEWVARYYAGSALYGQQRLEETLAILDPLAQEHFESQGYIALAAQIGWERGLATLARGSSSKALEIFEASREAFDRLGDRANSAMLRNFATTVIDLAGDSEGAWRVRRQVLQDLAREGDNTRKIIALGSATTAMIRREEWARARPLLGLAIEAAAQMKDATRISIGLAQRSAVLAALGDASDAQRDLTALRSHVMEIESADVRAALLLDSRYAEALLLRDTNPHAAIEQLTLALADLNRSGRAMFHSRIYLERNRLYQRTGNRLASSADISAGLASIETYRDAIVDPQLRAMAMVSADALVQDGIKLALQDGRHAEAFGLAESARGRTLVESFNRLSPEMSSAPLSLEQIQQALSPRSAIIEYALVHNRLATFIITPKTLHTVQTPISPQQLLDVVRAVAAQNDTTRDLERAWRFLVEPIAAEIATFERIVIVPDRRLGAIPFAALRDPRRGRYLIDDVVVSVAPSASFAILSSRRALSPNRASVLSIGASDFDRGRFAKLQPLPLVEAEARNVAAVYGNGRVLIGAAATPRAIEAAMLQSGIVHFAGHSIASPYDATASALILAPDEARETITAAEIARLNLGRTRLVMLSSCGAATAGSIGDGVENLATAFLVAGVASVVAASWNLEDREAADLAGRFHREYRVDADAARAFREAVRTIPRESATAPPTWAVVTPFGGSPGLVKKERGK